MKLALPCLLALALSARGATYTAADVSQQAVSNAILLAVDGDTVLIPAGSANWTNTVTISAGISVIGSGTNSTFITDWITNDPPRIFSISTTAPKFYRLSNLTLVRGKGSGRNNDDQGGVQLSGTSKAIRLDHLYFNNIYNENIVLYSTVGGLIDQCTFRLDTFGKRAVMFFNGGTYGDDAWAADAPWGTTNTMYFENNRCYKAAGDVFYSMTDGWSGGNIVIRYCNLVNVRVSNHGTETSQRYRSGRSMEVYGNTFNDANYPGQDSAIYLRGGGALVFSNSFSTGFNYSLSLNAYRLDGPFQPWNVADGTFLWDGADVTDGAGTPGGAGDGVFEYGSATSGSTSSMTDSTKMWTVNQWAGYTLREVTNFIATSGSSGSATVSGAAWSANQYAGYTVTKGAHKGLVASNNGTTLTLNSSSYFPVDFTGGGAFTLSRARRISSNTSTVLTTANETDIPAPVWFGGMLYEIRRVSFMMDQPGAGKSDDLAGASGNTIDNQSLHQGLDPIYYWNNTVSGGSFSVTTAGYGNIVSGTHYISGAKPGYTPLRYPHPLNNDAVPTATTINVGTLILR